MITFSQAPQKNTSLILPIFAEDFTSTSRNIFSGLTPLQKRSVKRILSSGSTPKSGTVPAYSNDALVLISILEKDSDGYALQKKGTSFISLGKQYHQEHLTILPGSLWKFPDKWNSLIDGIYLGNYDFKEYRGTIWEKEQEKNPETTIKSLTIIGEKNDERKYWAHGISLTKDIINTPPSIATPSFVEELVQKEFKGIKNVKISVLKEKELKKLNMNGILSVGQASNEESRLLVIEYTGGNKKEKPTALVGKGVTYDTGGLSIKPGRSMKGMKKDLGGAATVIGGLHSIASAQIKKNIVAVIPLAENLVSRDAYKPDDIITMANGVTVEVTNTDAEGRLLLGDALWYAQKHFSPSKIIDLATLTGACLYAVGDDISAVFSTTDNLMKDIQTAADTSNEPVWRLPLYPRYKKLIRSKIADIVNAAYDFPAGTIQAALFLQHFVDQDTPWAHFDIAFSSFDDSTNRATGRHVRTLFEMVKA